jgi:V8-like Glu-specific endopeptidase/cell wall-associated NlpC family hydrolase
MPRIQANRDRIDDRFSVLGFTVRTESPLFEVAVATDPNLFRPENRSRRARANFYSSRAHGVTRARRGEAVYLLPPDVLSNFIGQPKLYFGLATYRENSRGTPDFVQAPSDGSMHVNIAQLTERGLRRSLAPQLGASYGQPGERDASLDWGGDAARMATPAPSPASPPAATPARAPSATTPAAAAAYNDGFGPLPEKSPTPAPVAQAQELLLRDYNGGLLEQLRFFGESVQWFAGVNNTRDFPHSAICQVFDPARGPEAEQGTAFYIGRNLLLTAAHVVDGKSSLIIVPGKNGQGVDTTHEPFGRFTVSSGDWRKHDNYHANSRDFDFAIIKTPNAAPGGRWFNLLEELRQSRPEGVAVCGYSVRSRQSDLVSRLVSGTIDTRKQHLHGGAVREVSNETFSYDIQTLPGNSGSPVYWIEAGAFPRAHLVGIHVAGTDDVTNRGCRLTDAKIAWIRARATEWGQSNAMEVDDENVATALAIPLDPGAGGRSIGTSALQAGDIIVSTTRHWTSRIIRLGTISPVSHVMLYVGDGKVIEAIGSGVREVTLAQAIDDAILAVAYRHPQLDASRAATVVAHARTHVNNPYNYAGVAYQGYRILNPLPAAVIDVIGRRLGVEPGQAGAVYCSELVLEAFQRAGVPLTSGTPSQSTPDQVVQIARSNLSYVGHLKAEDVPLGIQLGMADAMDYAGANTGYGSALAATPAPAPDAAARTLTPEAAAAARRAAETAVAAPAPAPIVQMPLAREAQLAPVVTEIASAVAGAAMSRVADNSGDISWQLDQLRGLKHPNDRAPDPVPAFHDGPVIRLVGWPKIDVGGIDEISAGFEIRWQYNGRSLGNVQISNVATNDAVGWGLKVEAQIMDDNIVYPTSNPTFAALRIRFNYTFSCVVGSDRLAFREIHLFANGSYNLRGDWTQNTFF